MKSFETGPPRIACAIVPFTGRDPIVPRFSTPCKMSDPSGTVHPSCCRASCGELRPLMMERTEGVDGEDLPRSKRDVMAELLHQPVIDVARLGALAQDGLPDPRAARPLAWKVGRQHWTGSVVDLRLGCPSRRRLRQLYAHPRARSSVWATSPLSAIFGSGTWSRSGRCTRNSSGCVSRLPLSVVRFCACIVCQAANFH